MNYIFAHVIVLTRTITDVYEMPMKFQSEFCKISFRKVSNNTLDPLRNIFNHRFNNIFFLY
jgi:hypothetical protein